MHSLNGSESMREFLLSDLTIIYDNIWLRSDCHLDFQLKSDAIFCLHLQSPCEPVCSHFEKKSESWEQKFIAAEGRRGLVNWPHSHLENRVRHLHDTDRLSKQTNARISLDVLRNVEFEIVHS